MTHRLGAKEQGMANPLFISTVTLAIVSVLAVTAAAWGIYNYIEQKADVDGKIDTAVTDAKKEQADELEAKFSAREKEPNRDFLGPEDYGELSFKYPKTWSVYIKQDSTQNGDYEAFLNPVSVPPVSDTQRYALRVKIQNQDYDKVINTYSTLVKKGDLKSSAVTANGTNGTRLDGNFTKNIRGSAVLFKIRDKTVVMRTDADTFKPDFDALITTIKFNQ